MPRAHLFIIVTGSHSLPHSQLGLNETEIRHLNVQTEAP